MPAVGPRAILERDLPELLELLSGSVPALAARPFLAALLTSAIQLGIGSVYEYRERIRRHPIVPYAAGHRPTRRELAAYVRRRPELRALEDDLVAAEAASGRDRERRWEDLRRRVGEAQADLAAPLDGNRGTVAALDGLLARLARAGTTELPEKKRLALIRLVRKELEDDD